MCPIAGQGFTLAIAELELYPQESDLIIQTDQPVDQTNAQVVIDSSADLIPLFGPAGELVRMGNRQIDYLSVEEDICVRRLLTN